MKYQSRYREHWIWFNNHKLIRSLNIKSHFFINKFHRRIKIIKDLRKSGTRGINLTLRTNSNLMLSNSSSYYLVVRERDPLTLDSLHRYIKDWSSLMKNHWLWEILLLSEMTRSFLSVRVIIWMIVLIKSKSLRSL